ncbi:hypothetical protein [Saccharothrix yanglingensis]|uniref:Transcriptional regulator n=1 Tax=Saccharothrix yanglingensis TaxID=659496 RepID=A0ABU0X6Z2_9PSEU|nr:hypothetical protein [Saccharothrix yanglingensis]MDQ2587895.1 hypothetical protein [Saccharothrix yanglingensis]
MRLVDVELARHDWGSLPVAGDRAAATPRSLVGLLSAHTEEDADRYYWRLENVVVVQGGLYEAAPAVVSVLLAGLAGRLSEPAEEWVLELLFQLVAGESSAEAVDRGHPDLGDRCRRVAREGLWLLYSELGGPRGRAVRAVLERVDEVSDRLTALDA